MSINPLGAIFIILLSAHLSFASQDQNAPEPVFYLGGIQVNEPDHSKWISGLKQFGMNTVSVTVYARQGEWDSDDLRYAYTDDSVIDEIRTAKSRGLNVVLILRVALDHGFAENRFLWHGMIMPRSDAELQNWFDKYTKFAIKWALVAQRECVDVFVIGSEMNALSATKPVSTLPDYFSYFDNEALLQEENTDILSFARYIGAEHLGGRGEGSSLNLRDYIAARHEARTKWSDRVSYVNSGDRLAKINKRRRLLGTLWRHLIDRVGARFKGRISYAANFDNYNEVDFWDRLDFIGINAYFPLRDSLEIAEQGPEFHKRLEQRWQEILSDINRFRSQNNISNKRVIFTELGYTFRRHSTVFPWSSEGFSLVGGDNRKELLIWKEEPFDFEERASAVRALYSAYKKLDEGFLAGMLYWKFSTIKEHYRIEPFLVYLGPDARDPVLYELRKFLN
jgi:hypothetical protein